MIFDALTIAGAFSGALSGGFVLATAMSRAPSRTEHRRYSSPSVAGQTRSRPRRAHTRRARAPWDTRKHALR